MHNTVSRINYSAKPLLASMMATALFLVGAVFSVPIQANAGEDSIKQEIVLTVDLPEGQDYFILPTAQMQPSSNLPFQYDWQVSYSENGGQSWSLPEHFSGDSGKTAASWPVYSGLPTGEEVQIKIEPTDPDTWGWLGSFSTAVEISAWTYEAHPSAELITAVGDIPFRALCSGDNAYENYISRSGGRNLLRLTSNLTTVGSFLDRERDADWKKTTKLGQYFLQDAFNGSGVTGFPEGSLDTSGIQTVEAYAFEGAFQKSGITEFPTNSWQIENIVTTTGFMRNFAADSRLAVLPEGSMKINPRQTELHENYMNSAFSNTFLTSLPEGSFDLTNVTKARAGVFAGTFSGTLLEELPAGSFNVSNMVVESSSQNTFSSTFENTPLKSLPEGSFEFSAYNSQTSIVLGHFFKKTFSGTQLSLTDALRVLNAMKLSDDEVAGRLGYSSNLAEAFANSDTLAGIITPEMFPYLKVTLASTSYPNTFQKTNVCVENSAQYARWGLIECPKVSFQNGADDVTGTVNSIVAYPTQQIELPSAENLQRSGYEFAGWKASDGTVYFAGDEYVVQKADVTFTAIWTSSLIEVTAKVPTKTSVLCDVEPQLVIPTQLGVKYVQTGTSGNVVVTAEAESGYVLAPGSENTWTIDLSVTPCDTVIGNLTVLRHSGTTRYGTSFAVNEWANKVGNPVFIATGEKFPDALTIDSAVTQVDGSLVLTNSATLSVEARNSLKLLKPSQVYIVGQTNAVSQHVETQIRALVGQSVQVERVGGQDRYETSQLIFGKFFAGQTSFTSQKAFIATGEDHSDALVSAAVASSINSPVLLVRGSAEGAEALKNIAPLLDSEVAEVHIAGGENAINADVEETLKENFTVQRHGGSDRYETSTLLNEYLDSQTDSSQVTDTWLATGTDFADALSASVPAGNSQARLYLARKSCIPSQVLESVWDRLQTTDQNLHLTGGNAVLDAKVENLTVCE